jgi:hypothetical protein
MGWYGRWADGGNSPACHYCKGVHKKGFKLPFLWILLYKEPIMFTYSKLSIDSGIHLYEIEEYFATIGAVRSSKGTYLFMGLEIQVTPKENFISPSFEVPFNTIEIIKGERAVAEDFFTNFRMHFLRAGG